MKLLFMGLLFDENSLADAYKYSKCGVQMAPHLFQKKLIDGFCVCDNVDLTVINVPPIGSFPMHYKKLFSPRVREEKHTQIGYINLPRLKYKHQARRLQRELKKRVGKNEACEIIFYSFHEPFLAVAKTVKEKYPQVHTTLIQTEAIPGRGGTVTSKKAIRKGNRWVRKAHNVDRFILLSQEAAGPVEIGKRPHILAECMADAAQPCSAEKTVSQNIFLYAGSTQKMYGFRELVDAFEYLPEAELWICGHGDADAYIREKAKTCQNIKHFGMLNQQEVADLRDKCDFLINPRRPTGTYTKYSFPSKTAEYMMSGKPTVMYRLEAIPAEYDEYLTYLTESAPEKMADELRDIIRADYGGLKEKGRRARQFMLDHKTGAAQAKRICDFLSETLGDIQSKGE